MRSMSKEYSKLPADEHAWDDAALRLRKRTEHSQRWARIGPILLVVLLSSLMANLYSLHRVVKPAKPKAPPSAIAGLEWNVPVKMNYSSRYNSADRAVEDEAWDAWTVRPESLTVALDDSYAESMGLLHAQRWPWDDTKGVYVLNSGHELHCLQMVRETINHYHDGIEVAWSHGHVMHCLEYLLQNVLCVADDTPLYTGLVNDAALSDHPMSGDGTTKVCRDWNKLKQWADEHSACYKAFHGHPRPDEFSLYKFCPDGSRPWEKADLSKKGK